MPTIRLSNEWLPDAGVRAFHENADCFVSAARGEAWNLPAFDAMLYGRQIIVPFSHGSDDYLKYSRARRVTTTPAPAFGNVQATRTDRGMKLSMTVPQGLDSKSMWLEPNLGELAYEMRLAYQNRVRTCDPDRITMAALFGRHAVGELIKYALEAA
jgi:hypothetical protein